MPIPLLAATPPPSPAPPRCPKAVSSVQSSRPNSFSRIGNGAQARKARAPQRVFQRINISLQPAPKFATMHGSHAVPLGGMEPSRHARFTQELSFGHWKMGNACRVPEIG